MSADAGGGLRGGPVDRGRAATALEEQADRPGSSAGRFATPLLGGRVADVDLAVAGRRGARRARDRRGAGGHGLRALRASSRPGGWSPGDGGWQVDVAALRGGTIEADLRARDFTRQRDRGAAGRRRPDRPDRRPRRPRGGASCASRPSAPSPTTRCGSLRAARLACRARPRARAGDRGAGPRAPPARRDARRRAPVRRAARAASRARPARAGSRCSTSWALPPVVLPELEALRGVGQSANHHLDVHGHTLDGAAAAGSRSRRDLPSFAASGRRGRRAARRAARRRAHPAATRSASARSSTTSASRQTRAER